MQNYVASHMHTNNMAHALQPKATQQKLSYKQGWLLKFLFAIQLRICKSSSPKVWRLKAFLVWMLRHLMEMKYTLYIYILLVLMWGFRLMKWIIVKFFHDLLNRVYF